MKVLIADKLSASAINKLESLGCVVISNPELSAESLVEAISDFEVLVVRSTKVSAAVIDASTALSLIIRAGAGVNTIDLAAASKRGIHVTNCPGKNTEAVAELAREEEVELRWVTYFILVVHRTLHRTMHGNLCINLFSSFPPPRKNAKTC